jgi:hypothetical protein
MMDRRLFELLPRCTAKLSIPGKAGYGTGFFVANGLILTCSHVVKDTENIPIKVCWQNQEDFTEAVIDFYLPDPYDLALLRFTPPISDLPCVYLEESVQPEDKLYCYGYTDNFPKGESVTFECEGFTGDNPPLLKFKDGQTRPGLSGSPLLNLRTGVKSSFKDRLIIVIKNFFVAVFIGIMLGGFLGMIVGILFVVINGLIRGLSDLFVQGFSLWIKPVIDWGLFGLVVGLIGGLIWGLSGPELPTRTVPNQGIWNSAIHAIIFAVIGAGIVGIAYYYFYPVPEKIDYPFYEINRIRIISFLSMMAGIVCGYIPAGKLRRI